MLVMLEANRIADYAWLKMGRKYWNLWMGNPFMVTLYKIPIEEATRDEIVEEVNKTTLVAKARFEKDFPGVEWLVLARP